MAYPVYSFKTSRSRTEYEFVSSGPAGDVIKIVSYYPTEVEDIFNLGFGDKDPETEEVNDQAVTNNKDWETVLATVASTIYEFTNAHKNATIFITGSSDARTRLYQITISKNLKAIKKDFVLFALNTEDVWEEFEENKKYLAFLISRK